MRTTALAALLVLLMNAADVPAERASAPAIVDAWDEALAQVLSQLEADLREQLAPKSEG